MPFIEEIVFTENPLLYKFVINSCKSFFRYKVTSVAAKAVKNNKKVKKTYAKILKG